MYEYSLIYMHANGTGTARGGSAVCVQFVCISPFVLLCRLLFIFSSAGLVVAKVEQTFYGSVPLSAVFCSVFQFSHTGTVPFVGNSQSECFRSLTVSMMIQQAESAKETLAETTNWSQWYTTQWGDCETNILNLTNHPLHSTMQ